jgi:hypothetical protein
MKRMLKTLAVAAAAVSATSAIAAPTLQWGPATNDLVLKQQKQTLKLYYKFECRVQGTPVEFPNDIVIVNKSVFTIPAGTTIHYKVPGSWWKSAVTPSLTPGAGMFVANAIPGGLVAGTPCQAKK